MMHAASSPAVVDNQVETGSAVSTLRDPVRRPETPLQRKIRREAWGAKWSRIAYEDSRRFHPDAA